MFVDEDAFFRALQDSGARVLLIGRRALVALAIPVMTADYDLWIGIDDIEKVNDALAPLGLLPNHRPEEARRRGRYVLENDEHVVVFVAKAIPTVDGVLVAFDHLWARRQRVAFSDSVELVLPSIDDLILTKRFGARALSDAFHFRSLARRTGDYRSDR